MDIFGYTTVFFGRVQYINDKNDYGWEMKQLSEYAAKGNKVILWFFYYFCKISYFRISSMIQEESIHGMIMIHILQESKVFFSVGTILCQWNFTRMKNRRTSCREMTYKNFNKYKCYWDYPSTPPFFFCLFHFDIFCIKYWELWLEKP